jgi:outer membrane murein-binding lipoprotein Lpp
MMKSVIPILVILLGSSALAFADPLPGPYDLQGAKIVSEGAYFWLEITNNWRPSGGRNMGSDIFIRFPNDFSLHAVFINNQEVNETVLAVNDTLQIAVSIDPLDKVEILLSAPFLANNETVRHVVINVAIVSSLGGAVLMSNFHMSVVGLAFLPSPDALETVYEQLLTENANLNKTVDAMQSQVESLNNQVANLSTDRNALNQNVTSLNTEVANLNSRLINESYAVIVVAFAAALAIVTFAYLAVRRRRPTQIAGQSSTPNR